MGSDVELAKSMKQGQRKWSAVHLDGTQGKFKDQPIKQGLDMAAQDLLLLTCRK
jgi:hypothetical protein